MMSGLMRSSWPITWAATSTQLSKKARQRLNIPMYVNAWLGYSQRRSYLVSGRVVGLSPRGNGCRSSCAPSLDFFAPDIYIPDFKGTCALYSRSENPLFIPEAQDRAGNLFWALGHHAALGWSAFGIEDLNPEGQVAQAYKLLSEILPQFAEWQAAGKVNAILVAEGEKSTPISLGGYKISLSGGTGLGSETKPDSSAEIAGGVSLGSRALANDKRPFAIVVNTAPDEFLFIGANGDPGFALDGGSGKVIVASKDEGHFEHGSWVPGRRINGDELYNSGLPKFRIGMLKVRLIHVEN